MSRGWTVTAMLGVALSISVAGCDRGRDRLASLAGSHRAGSRPPASAAASDSGLGTSGADSAAPVQPGALRTVQAAPVVFPAGQVGSPFEVQIRTADPASANTRRFGTITLRIAARTRSPDLGQYPCGSCHLGRGMVLKDERITDAHQNIQPLHPAQTGGTCSTCHAADNVELLALRSGERTTLDHAYRLCAQCHFRQAESWAGGAHGKRLDAWQGRRVVMGCADCHDPHRPAIEARIPFRAPELERPALRRK